jgi:hypothetical protein
MTSLSDIVLTPEDTKTAIHLLLTEFHGGGCAYLMSRAFKGGTCGSENGRGSDCTHCATRAFLTRIGAL